MICTFAGVADYFVRRDYNVRLQYYHAGQTIYVPICEALRAPLSCSIAGYAKTVYFGVVILQYDNSGPRSAGALGGSQNILGVKIFYHTGSKRAAPLHEGVTLSRRLASPRLVLPDFVTIFPLLLSSQLSNATSGIQ